MERDRYVRAVKDSETKVRPLSGCVWDIVGAREIARNDVRQARMSNEPVKRLMVTERFAQNWPKKQATTLTST